MLYLVATPIGNLSDITLNALEVIKRCAYLLCEDTRRSRILLTHYKIDKPLVSFHKFNEKKQEDSILSDLEEGKEIVLISDAGHPCICDPGFRLVSACQKENLPYRVIPGPCAITSALTLAGIEPLPFQFLGYIPKKESLRKKWLKDVLFYKGNTLCFETPHQILKTLKFLSEKVPALSLIIAREITKKHEEVLRGSPEELLAICPTKGEFVLIIEPLLETKKFFNEEIIEWGERIRKEYQLSTKKTAKLLEEIKGIPKNLTYKLLKDRP